MRAASRHLSWICVAALLWPAASWADLACDAVYGINTTAGIGTIRKLASPYTDTDSPTVFASPALAGVNSLGINPKDLSKAYYFDTNSPPTSPATQKLYYVDLTLATPTAGNSATPSFVIPSAAGDTLAFGPDGAAYAYDYASGKLYKQALAGPPPVAQATYTFSTLIGTAAPSATVSNYKVNDIVVDAAGVVYAIGLYPKASPTSAHLLRFDPALPPQAQYVRAITLSPASPFPSLSSGLAFASTSTSTEPVLLWSQDSGTYEIKVSTGVASRFTPASRADLASCPRNTVVRRVTLNKAWAGASGGEKVTLTLGGAVGAVMSPIDGSSTAGGIGTTASALAIAGASVTLSEAFASNSAADFAATAACTRNADGAPVAVVGNAFTMPGDSDVSCQIDNRKRPRLTLVKAVSDAVGPTPAAPAAWVLKADGGAAGSISGASGTAAVTQAAVNEGPYLLSESGGVAGYALTGWSCIGASLSGNAVTLGAGADVTCTATNARVTTSLRLAKQVAGDAPVSPWNFTVSSSCLASPALVSIAPGGGTAQLDSLPTHATDGTPCAYALTEAARPGWSAGAWTCTNGDLTGANVTLRAGAVAECSITNTRTLGSIRLTKKVSGGDSTADWRFTIQSACLASPVTLTTPGAGGSALAAGLPTHAADSSPCAYALTETPRPGWAASAWTCTNADLTGANVTLRAGAVAECSITNTRTVGSIRLTKKVSGGDSAADWRFTIQSACLSSPATLTTPGAGGSASLPGLPTHAADGNACSYTLAEAAQPGWSAGGWSCSGGALQGSAVTLQANTEAACEITNTRTRGSIRLTKQVVGAAAPAEPWSFTLSAAAASCLAAPQTLTVPGDGGVISFSGLPTHGTDGAACSYALAEAAVAGWQIDTAASSALAGLVLSDATAPLAVTVVNRAIPPPQPVPSLPAWPLVSLLLAGWAARAAGRPSPGARRG